MELNELSGDIHYQPMREGGAMKLILNGKLAAATAIGAPIAAISAFNRYKKRYVVEDQPPRGTYPGDDLLPDDEVVLSTVAVEIDAPPEKVFPYLNQLGQQKAGFYSFQTLEHLAAFRIYNTYEIMDRWQDTKVGDWVFYGDQGVGHEIAIHEPNKCIVGVSDTRRPPAQQGAVAWLPHGCSEYAWTWGFFLEELPNNRTRLVSRNTVYVEVCNKIQMAIVVGMIWGWSSGVMTTRMLTVIKALAEGRPIKNY